MLADTCRHVRNDPKWANGRKFVHKCEIAPRTAASLFISDARHAVGRYSYCARMIRQGEFILILATGPYPVSIVVAMQVE